MTRRIVPVVVAVATIALLAACDGAATDPPTAPTAPPRDEGDPAGGTHMDDAASTTLADPATTAPRDDGSTPGRGATTTAPAHDGDGGAAPSTTTIDVESDAGRLVVGEIPSDLAERAPVPDDAVIDLVTTTSDGATFVATSPSSIETVTAFYSALVADAGGEPSVTELADGVIRIEGDIAEGPMSAVIGRAPQNAVSITVEISS